MKNKKEYIGKELAYFKIGKSYGGNQDWLRDRRMRNGGCGSLAACESCIYFAEKEGKIRLYPYTLDEIKKEDYIHFSSVMKPYLRPRPNGIHKLEMFMEGFEQYLKDRGEETLQMTPFSGENTVQEAEQVIRRQIDGGYPIPCLTLRHKRIRMHHYVWHWFMLTGYREKHGRFYVKAVTYGEGRWVHLEELWDTGFKQKGGLILYHWKKQ